MAFPAFNVKQVVGKLAPVAALFVQILLSNMRNCYGFKAVTIPHITKKDLYEKSGHWSKFADDLFHVKSREGHQFAMKPMNCPHHTQIYDSRPRSYRELPIRYR